MILQVEAGFERICQGDTTFLPGIWGFPGHFGILAEGPRMYEKVGRLKPDTVRDCIRIIVDGPGEIGTMSRSDAEKVPVSPVGIAEFSASGDGRVHGRGQAGLELLDNWQRKKAALFEEEKG